MYLKAPVREYRKPSLIRALLVSFGDVMIPWLFNIFVSLCCYLCMWGDSLHFWPLQVFVGRDRASLFRLAWDFGRTSRWPPQAGRAFCKFSSWLGHCLCSVVGLLAGLCCAVRKLPRLHRPVTLQPGLCCSVGLLAGYHNGFCSAGHRMYSPATQLHYLGSVAGQGCRLGSKVRWSHCSGPAGPEAMLLRNAKLRILLHPPSCRVGSWLSWVAVWLLDQVGLAPFLLSPRCPALEVSWWAGYWGGFWRMELLLDRKPPYSEPTVGWDQTEL